MGGGSIVAKGKGLSIICRLRGLSIIGRGGRREHCSQREGTEHYVRRLRWEED